VSSDGLASFNSLPRVEAESRLYACCASHRWASRVAGGRPYANLEAVLSAADSVWTELGPPDWLAALSGHPRLGERGGHSPGASEREQARVMNAKPDALAELAEENRRYEARFGHVFLIAAAGRTADEVLAELRRRMDNEPAAEIKEAADEHRKINRLRLQRMLAG